MITLDASGLFALLNRADPYLASAGILAEIACLVERRLGADALEEFVADLEGGGSTFHCGEGDLPRIRELARRCDDMPLGFADAGVIACAERSGGRGGMVLTLDLRHFGVVAHEGRITPLPG